MLRLTARYADQWNTAWLGQPDALAERLAKIHNACHEVGRDPATLAITVGVQVAFPDLGEVNAFTKIPLSGSPEEIAQAFQGYEEAGAAHLILYLSPFSMTALQRVAEGLRLYHSD
jgi:alkanesulfonate monooxygenase SsuD/methylene tetrahydromethanopterin reductase-like flavin-dependent oxidoreductase (luciferase family)